MIGTLISETSSKIPAMNEFSAPFRQIREAKICLQYDISIFERYLILVVGRLLVECNYLHFSFYKSLLKVNQALIPQSCRVLFLQQ